MSEHQLLVLIELESQACSAIIRSIERILSLLIEYLFTSVNVSRRANLTQILYHITDRSYPASGYCLYMKSRECGQRAASTLPFRTKRPCFRLTTSTRDPTPGNHQRLQRKTHTKLRLRHGLL